MRTKLFISHATPTDNKFAAWLAAKLELHGYDVWVDIKELNPASDFWETIEKEIRENTIKFLFVATITSVLGNRDGIKKELAVADRVRKSGVSDFIVPLRADDVSFDDLPVEAIRQNTIDFNNDWASGLLILLDYLEKQNINKLNLAADRMTDALNRWRKLSTNDTSNVVTVNDKYYSNLFPVTLPKFMYTYNDVNIETELKKRHKPYKKFENCIFTFVCPYCVKSYCGYDTENHSLELKSLIESDEAMTFYEVEIKRPSSVCINLINWEICNVFYSRGMRLYKPNDEIESKKKYFFKSGVKSKRHENDKYGKSLSGKYKGKNWHYAQSAYFTTAPFVGILVRSHLLFTDSKNNILSDAQQIIARRSKGKRFFNNDWRDLLQSSMFSHSGGKTEVVLNLCCGQSSLSISREPYIFEANKGYIEPKIEPIENLHGGYENDDE